MSLHLYYGGTFDPVHNGHLAIARAARDALACPVALMPAADPPHRPAPGASAEQRAEMLDLAVQGEPGLWVDRRELARKAPSYSVETLRGLRAEWGPDAAIALLVGADSFRGLPTWREGRALFTLAHFVVAERAESPLDSGLPAALADDLAGRWTDKREVLLHSPAGRVLRLRQPLHMASATAIRRQIAAGAPWRHSVPAAVADYIEHHRLYRDGSARTASL
ncbi:MAG: nicotinate-nucleotide adenylyltransferase [Luteimonas sp.]